MLEAGSSVRRLGVREPPARSDLRARRETLALVALGAALAIAPELLGGVYPWGILISALLAALALAAAIWVNQRRTELGGLLWGTALVALVWTAVQALPMPCTLVRLLAPESAQQLARVHALFDRSAPVFCALSRDPGATRAEIVKGLALLCTYAAAAILVRLGQRRNVMRGLGAAGALLCLVTFAHLATGATQVFGVYTPLEVREPALVAPLLNVNSLGGALALCWPISLAFAITARKTSERALWLVTATALATAVLMTRSRGAAGALGLELIVFALLGLRVRRQHLSRKGSTTQERWSIALAIVAVIALSVYSSYGEVVHEFEGGNWDKVKLIGAAASFAWEHFWLGIGRGAFSSVAAAQMSGVVRFDYPENFVVQWAAEWGTPLCLALFAAIALALLKGVRRASSWERCAAIAGTLGLAAQNLFDIGLELVGVSMLAAAALACATQDRDAQPHHRHRQPFRTPMSALALGTLVCALSLGPAMMREYTGDVIARMRTAMAHGTRQQVLAEAAVGMFAHPSEPSFALLAATDALRRGDPQAGRWINRSLQLAPLWASAHAQAAVWLWNGGHHKQALLELATAARTDANTVYELACTVAGAWPRGIVAMAAKTAEPALFLERLTRCPKLGAAIVPVDRGILQYDPTFAPARLREFQRVLDAGDRERALALAREVRRDHPGLVGGVEAEARALLQLDRLQEARAAIERGLRNQVEPRGLRELQLLILTKLRDHGALTRVLGLMRGSAVGADELAMVYHREAAIEKELGNPGAAMRAYQQAYDVAAQPGSLRAVADLARAIGDEGRARRLYAQLCAINPEDVSSCALAKGH